jgi:hypothetical protein
VGALLDALVFAPQRFDFRLQPSVFFGQVVHGTSVSPKPAPGNANQPSPSTRLACRLCRMTCAVAHSPS